MVRQQRRLQRLKPWRGRTAAAAAVTFLLLAGACNAVSPQATDPANTPALADDAPGAEREPLAPAAQPESDTAPDSPATDSTAPRRGGTLAVLLAADPAPITGWTPWDHVCAWSCRNVLDHVVETLTVVLPDGSIAPWLAESVSADASLQRWTVRLRADIAFTDGEPMNALTVKAGIDDYLRSGRASGSHLRNARIASVVVLDDLTLVIELGEPNAGLSAALAGPVGRVFSTAAAATDPDAFARTPVGTGPFVFRRWSPGEPVILEANRSYWRTAADGSTLPWVDEIRFTVIDDEQERLGALMAGQGDVLMSRSAEAATALADTTDRAGRPLSVIRRFDDNAGVVLFNLLRAPLDDIRVRQALIAASDQDELLRSLGPSIHTMAATQWWAPDSIWHAAEVAQEWPRHDLQRARSLLLEYSEDPERSDERDIGEAVQVRVLCTDDAALAQMTATLERQWESTGLVDVEVETLARTGLISRVTGSVVQNPSFVGDFTAACWRVGGESDPAVLASAAVGPVRTTPLNASNFTDEDLAALAGLIESTTARSQRQQAVAQFSAALNNEAPWVYLGYAVSVLAASQAVGGLGRTTLPDGETVEGHRLGVGRYDEAWLRRE